MHMQFGMTRLVHVDARRRPDDGSVAIRHPSWTEPFRSPTTLLAGIAVLAASACGSIFAGGGLAGAGVGSAKASYHGPSWASYLDTHQGRSCSLKGHSALVLIQCAVAKPKDTLLPSASDHRSCTPDVKVRRLYRVGSR